MQLSQEGRGGSSDPPPPYLRPWRVAKKAPPHKNLIIGWIIVTPPTAYGAEISRIIASKRRPREPITCLRLICGFRGVLEY